MRFATLHSSTRRSAHGTAQTHRPGPRPHRGHRSSPGLGPGPRCGGATGDAGAALLLASGSAAVLAGARTALAVHLVHLGRACRTVGLTAAPVHAAALRAAPRARRSLIAAAVGGSLSLVA